MERKTTQAGSGVQSWPRLLRPLLSLPIFYKVLIANSLIIFVGATGGTWLASHLNDSRQGLATPTSLIIFITVGWLVSVALNFLLLQIAFRPLMDLGKVMSRVQKGERSLRAPLTGLDPQADQLAATFNVMLEAIDEASRLRSTQIINAQEQERKRIARELHDETSQMLTSLLISLAILEKSVTSPEARERIADTRNLAHQTLRAIRNLSIDLRPSALDDLGLLPALRWYIKEYQQKCSIEVEFSATGFKGRLPAEMETVLYRIVQEALTNTARHANATKVSIVLREEEGAVYATISDNGCGFDVEALMKTPGQERGLGLAGMQERAVLLDGTLEIKSRPGEGTTIEVRLPLRQSDAESATYRELTPSEKQPRGGPVKV
ncbi:sensor histidine kinase [Thermogemmatispora sp.]|uniref:HAMP domain-containing sensor histidine kinase n=1 Tax=Thermogemmatispora sp. TaxID=1968838 RepID=UPI001D83B3CF|nr:sensor histidine kinase [Thermogemmatispora sp.]MBX5451604.1 sensor histidine kinase [Thermogemmatispora sp.]